VLAQVAMFVSVVDASANASAMAVLTLTTRVYARAACGLLGAVTTRLVEDHFQAGVPVS
jgi:hypothetical protein